MAQAGEAEKQAARWIVSDDLDVDSRLLPGAVAKPGELAPERPASSIDPWAARHGHLDRIRLGLRDEADYGHIFIWAPVLFGAGAAWWFSVSETPALASVVLLLVVSGAAALLAGAGRPGLRRLAASTLLLAAGAVSAEWESRRVHSVLLDSPVTTTIRGLVETREADGTGRWRYRIRLLETEEPRLKRSPDIVAVTGGRGMAIGLGEGIEGRARLTPPSGPALRGLNDFAFDAYFSGIGAQGFFYGAPSAWEPPTPAFQTDVSARVRGWIEPLRLAISARVRSVLPGDAGAFAASMVTDDRRAISKETTEALRLSGLAHIVAISGLNMALAAGLFFVGLRIALSLSQRIAHLWPVKRIAAVGALITVTGYYLISGFAVSAERAYVMMAIMLIAAIAGRRAISLRNVALSAMIILAVTPSAVLGPGFQMSYAATIALVVGYASWSRRGEGPPLVEVMPLLRPIAPVWRFFAAVFATSLIGGLSTALFSAEHFHRLAAWGLLANLLAMPVISFVVMPCGLAALLLMPLGLDWLPLEIMGWGLGWVIGVAHWTASLGGDWVTGRLPGWFFGCSVGGLLILALLRSRLRLIGFAVYLAAGLALAALPGRSPPRLIIHEGGRLLGLTTENGLSVSEQKPEAFIVDQWRRALRKDEIVKPEVTDLLALPRPGRDAPPVDPSAVRERMRAMKSALPRDRFLCEKNGFCAGRVMDGVTVVVIARAAFAGAACDLFEIVVAPVRLNFEECRSGARLVTLASLRRTGTLELAVEGEALSETPALSSISRSWQRHRAYDWRQDKFLE
ncbi:ComEC/Rec2 family competence protein [Rhizobium sp. TRM95796]|uniref:ComEC/Rec2 family competence protein n=1 Tax=Rhizobium sp. TRM95796 TaxID=2979862 RepID=UPI0021E89626|nr:ComEC/Rec2 family competence protein [Rhizobium sp. TRM95796]MCV3768537.1 ComEC/Rec2 family competence protein [Rhizobium sp. TRM95796]